MNFKERFIQQRKDFAELMKHYPFTTETLAGEEWRDIEGYDGKYQISNYGRVKSFKQKHRILTPSLDNQGYLRYGLKLRGKEKRFTAHRLVAEAFLPNPDNKSDVNHIDGIKWNSCVSNLEWVTRSENIKHAHDTGLNVAPHAENHPCAKLTNEQAVYVRENPDGLTIHQLATKFGISTRGISGIQRGETYRCVGGKIRTEKPVHFFKLSPELDEKIYCLYQTGEYSRRQLAEKFGASESAISYIIKKIDKKLERNAYYRLKLPNLDREKIRAEYRKGVKGCGSYALAKKYGCDAATILKIVRAGDAEYKPDEKKPPVPDNIREQIRAEYQKGVRGRGSVVLAKKYGVSRGTIIKIVHEK